VGNSAASATISCKIPALGLEFRPFQPQPTITRPGSAARPPARRAGALNLILRIAKEQLLAASLEFRRVVEQISNLLVRLRVSINTAR
jgi:hypothetical protein